LLQIIRAGNITAKDKPVKAVIRMEKRLAQALLAIFVIGVLILCATS